MFVSFSSSLFLILVASNPTLSETVQFVSLMFPIPLLALFHQINLLSKIFDCNFVQSHSFNISSL